MHGRENMLHKMDKVNKWNQKLTIINMPVLTVRFDLLELNIATDKKHLTFVLKMDSTKFQILFEYLLHDVIIVYRQFLDF